MLRILHISDLHMGSGQDVPLPRAARYAQLFPGLRGHNDFALTALTRLEAQLQREANVQTVITGDLTANGADDQFELARAFFLRSARVGRSVNVGLSAPPAPGAVIPGNHDTWGGSVLPTRRLGREWGRTFDPLPSVGNLVGLSDGWSLRFLRLDSNADVRWADNVLARGRFRSQLAALDRLLERVHLGDRELRVLLVHHSPWHQGRAPLYELEVDNDSRADLERLLEAHAVRVVLSGHTHRPLLGLRSVGSGTRVADLVAGTAAQDSAASAWRGGRPRSGDNSVLVHALEVDGDALAWETVAYPFALNAFRPAPRGASDLRFSRTFRPLVAG